MVQWNGMATFVYVLESEQDKKLYIGITDSVAARLKYHQQGRVRSTKSRRPLKLIGSKLFSSFAEARHAEVMLKNFKNPQRVRAWISSERAEGAQASHLS